MTEKRLSARLPLTDNISAIFNKLPDINLFRVAANARTLYPAFIQYMYLLFQPMELDSRIERLVILYVGKLSGCEYIWRQNVVVAQAMSIPPEEIDALSRYEMESKVFSEANRAAFRFTEEAVRLVEVSAPVYMEASRFFGPQAITELIFVIGTYMMLARIARIGHVPLDETPADPSKFKLNH